MTTIPALLFTGYACSWCDNAKFFGKRRVLLESAFVMITPDAERTMNTFLGISGELSEQEIDFDGTVARNGLYRRLLSCHVADRSRS